MARHDGEANAYFEHQSERLMCFLIQTSISKRYASKSFFFLINLQVPMKLKPLYVYKEDKYSKSKYEKYGSKLPLQVLQKYQDYPAHLQKKYLHYYLTERSKKT